MGKWVGKSHCNDVTQEFDSCDFLIRLKVLFVSVLFCTFNSHIYVHHCGDQ